MGNDDVMPEIAAGTKAKKLKEKAPFVAAPATFPVDLSPAPIGPDVAATAEETTMDATTTMTADKAQAMFADLNGRAKGAAEKTQKMFDDAVAFNKGNIEAMVESGKIAAKGMETMGRDAAEFARKSFEDATAFGKTLAATKSPTEFVKLQSDFARQAFDAMVAETSRSTEAMLKLAGEVAQPLSNRFTVAAETMKVAA